MHEVFVGEATDDSTLNGVMDGMDAVVSCLGNRTFKSRPTVWAVDRDANLNLVTRAAKAGATFISPFIGRLDDIALDGMDLIEDIRTIYDNFGFETEVLAASIRSANHVQDCARVGADVITAPPAVIKALANHPLTDKGLAAFLADIKAANIRIL